MDLLGGIVSGPRPGRMRDRRGRGKRGPLSLPGPLSPSSIPAHRPPREEFDLMVSDVLTSLRSHFDAESETVEVAVEEAPLLPEGWIDEVPLSTIVRNPAATRVVLFRLPMTHRSSTDLELLDLVWTTVLDRLGEIWHMSPDDLDPRPRG
ncbi:MAG: metallopeptidase family protein [Actinomycetota bacterium]|nr:metallopeptidase family protein [Actinomycetota bacterium]